MRPRRKILFVAEAVALAHVSRPLVLARVAKRLGYDVVFASDRRVDWMLRDDSFDVERVHSIPPERFLGAIAKGAPLFDHATLRRYVDDDLRLLDRVRPDLVVGDLRLSLSISARLAKVPYATISNAYWSPWLRDEHFEAPPLEATRRVPLALANRIFGLVRPLAFAWHAAPLNRVRRERGLAPLPSDMRYAYTDADYVLYADASEMYALAGAPGSHRFLGPVTWSPQVEWPAWADQLPHDRPIVYLTLGSSGNPEQLPAIARALATHPVSVIVATAGRPPPRELPPNVFTAEYLPGDEAARRAALVVSNGGAPTSQQALAAGVPVLGIATNMDQMLNMRAVARIGAGIGLRAERMSATEVAHAAARIMADASFANAARSVATIFARYDTTQRFRMFLDGIAGE